MLRSLLSGPRHKGSGAPDSLAKSLRPWKASSARWELRFLEEASRALGLQGSRILGLQGLSVFGLGFRVRGLWGFRVFWVSLS